MAHCPNNSAPATGSNSARPQESARALRVNQAQYVEAKLRDGLSPVAVAGVAALLTQLESMQMLPNASLSITTEVASYRRTLTHQQCLGWARLDSPVLGRKINRSAWPQPGHQIRTRDITAYDAR